MSPLLALALLALALLAPVPQALAAAQPYEGRWAEDPAWCSNTRKSGSDELPITIGRRSIETFASFCRVLSVVRTSRMVWRLRASCRDEGQTEQEPRTAVTFVLRVDGNRLYLHDDTGVQTFTRCPR
jgi:hypothetical protein